MSIFNTNMTLDEQIEAINTMKELQQLQDGPVDWLEVREYLNSLQHDILNAIQISDHNFRTRNKI